MFAANTSKQENYPKLIWNSQEGCSALPQNTDLRGIPSCLLGKRYTSIGRPEEGVARGYKRLNPKPNPITLSPLNPKP